MQREALVTLLFHQLKDARNSATRLSGRDAALVNEIAVGLRWTLVAALADKAPCAGCGSFLLQAREEDDLVVLSPRGRIVPVRESYLRHLLELSGVRLEPSQTILLEPEVAQDLVEEALAALGQEGQRLRKLKVELIAASVASKEYTGLEPAVA